MKVVTNGCPYYVSRYLLATSPPSPLLSIFSNSQLLWGHSLGLNQPQPVGMAHANGSPQDQHLHGSLAMGWVHAWWACVGKVHACMCSTSIKGWVHLALSHFLADCGRDHISIHDTLSRHSPACQFTQHFHCQVIIACQPTTHRPRISSVNNRPGEPPSQLAITLG